MNGYEPGSNVIKEHPAFPKVRRTFIGPYHFERIRFSFISFVSNLQIFSTLIFLHKFRNSGIDGATVPARNIKQDTQNCKFKILTLLTADERE